MYENVKTIKAHFGSGKWVKPGEVYRQSKGYATVMEALGYLERGKFELPSKAGGKSPETVAVAVPASAPEPEAAAEPEAVAVEADPMEEAVAAYVAKFGKKPHHKMKLESIVSAVAGDE